jgi:hypothetical protein
MFFKLFLFIILINICISSKLVQKFYTSNNCDEDDLFAVISIQYGNPTTDDKKPSWKFTEKIDQCNNYSGITYYKYSENDILPNLPYVIFFNSSIFDCCSTETKKIFEVRFKPKKYSLLDELLPNKPEKFNSNPSSPEEFTIYHYIFFGVIVIIVCILSIIKGRLIERSRQKSKLK